MTFRVTHVKELVVDRLPVAKAAVMSICHRSGEINGLLVCERRFKKDPQGLPGSSEGGGCYKLKII